MNTLCTDSKKMFSVYNFYGSMNFQLTYFSLNGQVAESGDYFSDNDELSSVPFGFYKAYKLVKK